MAIEVPISLKDEVSAAASKAAASIDQLNKAFKDVNKSAEITAEITAVAAASAAAGEVEAATETLAHAETLDEVAAAQKKVVSAINKNIVAQKKLDGIRKKAGKEQDVADKRRKRAFKETIKGLRSTGSAIAALGAVGIIGAAIAKTVQWAAETTKTERGLKNMLNILTKGRGEETLKVLTEEAKSLNISVDEAGDSFAKFRTAGVDNIEAIDLLRFEADIKSLKLPADLAAKALEKVGEATKRIAAGEKSADVINELSEGLDGVGDGSLAAAAGVGTLDGRIKAAGLKWEEFAKKAAVPITEALLDFSDIVLGVPDDLRAIGRMIGEAFTGVPIINAKGEVVGYGDSLLDLPGKAASAVGDVASSIATTVSDWAKAGVDALSGFIDNFDLVGAVAGMAGDAIAAVKSAFGSKSPSTVFAKIGADVGAGFTGGVEDTPAPTLAAPLTPALAADATPGGGGGNSFEITINVTGDADGETTARAIRREVVSAFNQFGFSGGIA